MPQKAASGSNFHGQKLSSICSYVVTLFLQTNESCNGSELIELPFSSAQKMSATKCVVDKSVGFLVENWCSLSIEAASLDSRELHEWNEIQAQKMSRMLSLCCNFPTAKSIWISQLYPQNQEVEIFSKTNLRCRLRGWNKIGTSTDYIKDDPHDMFKPLTWKWMELKWSGTNFPKTLPMFI